jgi:Bacterial pre-peptidase C-terminal domain/Bacterial Ig-like domain (group 2)
MTRSHVLRFFSIALIAVFAYACDDDISVGPSAGLLLVEPLFAAVDRDATLELSATLNGDNVPVTWESADPSIATVSSAGVVTGIAGGLVAITAKLTSDPTQQRSSSVTVIAPPTLEPGEPFEWTGVASGNLARNEGLVYRFIVPEGASSLTVTFTGGTGDGDIYVQYNSAPDANGEDETGCHSFNAANDEECTVTNPQAGTWYVFVAVWDAFEGATLSAEIN